ncbi:hypothetical protein ACQPZX_32745 [Actinoplanes sp. CA-142083]|uniref:hypothetical protein n=1 Tax=Actinoplanes sp. CA-142083 TaxID=3239903 RepID=UPI003D8E217D
MQHVEWDSVLVTQEANLVFDRQFVAYRSGSPVGPFTGPIPLWTAPGRTSP